MFVTIRRPAYPLNRYIEQLVYYTDYYPAYTAVYMLPEGKVELLIPLDDGARTFYTGSGFTQAVTVRKAIVCGMQQKPVYTRADHGATMVAVKFTSGGSFPFVQQPVVEVNNLFVDAEQVFGRSILFLREQLAELAEPEAILRRLEQYLFDCFDPLDGEQKMIDFTLRRLMNWREPAVVQTIAAEVGYSHKQFIHLFKKHVGLTPKLFQRVTRFNQALQQMHTAEEPNWFDVSYRYGYYDQAHFINEFKRFSTITPESYLLQREQYPNFVPLYG